MNPKIALFLSTTLTAFVVATLSGVVNKVTNNPEPTVAAPVQVAVEQLPTSTLEEPTEQPTSLPTPPQPLGPEQAAALAAEAISRQDVYSVETSTYEGAEAYKVVFSSGDVVYIGLDSQVLAKTKLQAVVVSVQPTAVSKHQKSNDDGGSQQQNSGGEHENENEHESEQESEHEGGED